MNIEEVKDFIRTANKKELEVIKRMYDIQLSEVRHDHKESFRVGDIVKINHHKVDSSLQFRIEKINRKNFKMTCTSNSFKKYTVAPNLVERIEK
jgi:hypothetical protein